MLWFKKKQKQQEELQLPLEEVVIRQYERDLMREEIPIEERVKMASIVQMLRSAQQEGLRNATEVAKAQEDKKGRLGAAFVTGLLGAGGLIAGSAVKAHFNERYARNRETYEQTGCYTSITDKSILAKGVDFT